MKNKTDRPASLFIRLLARMIDILVGILIGFFIVYLDAPGSLGLALFVLPVAYLLFNVYLISKVGGTIGKLVTMTVITDLNGKLINFKRAFLRNPVGYRVSASMMGLGFWWIAIDKNKQAWHDMMADTKVTQKGRSGYFIGIVTIIILLVLFGLTTGLFVEKYRGPFTLWLFNITH